MAQRLVSDCISLLQIGSMMKDTRLIREAQKRYIAALEALRREFESSNASFHTLFLYRNEPNRLRDIDQTISCDSKLLEIHSRNQGYSHGREVEPVNLEQVQ
jgi:hypothetical protein